MSKEPEFLNYIDCEECDAHNVRGVDIKGEELCKDCFEKIKYKIVGDFND